MIQSEEKKGKKMKKNEHNLRNLWDIIKYSNIPIMGVLEGEERGEKKT